MPAAGYYEDEYLNGGEEVGMYWTRTLDTGTKNFSRAYALSCGKPIDEDHPTMISVMRYYGLQVRPVYKPE